MVRTLIGEGRAGKTLDKAWHGSEVLMSFGKQPSCGWISQKGGNDNGGDSALILPIGSFD
jgi:hypothetical protein